MENFNLKLVTVENNLTQILAGVPVGAAYFLLKTKVRELETQYYNQAQIEYAAARQKEAQAQAEGQQTTESAQQEGA